MNILRPHLVTSPQRTIRRPLRWPAATSAFMGACMGVAVLLTLRCHARAEQAKVVVQVEVASSTKSSFIDDPNFGKDPFFPKSERRRAHTAVATNAFVEVSIPDLVLKGISGTRDRRLALINNYTIAVGEMIDMKIGTQIVPVRCLEIRDKAITIEVRGQTRDLRFRRDL